ncbi:Pleckstrin-like proteiny domain containing protein [Aphelenchoides besseyi]|nr:Pleckstrin-like proteiny domain containing protein [Aphelenchoides besseyi]
MFHLAPVGLDPPRKVNRDRHSHLQSQIVAAIQKFESTDTVYTTKEPETRELLKSLDAFFCHGYLIPPKSYWICVREFLPQSERKSLSLEWNTRSERTLSLAWLKNALNQQSLHFQLLALVRQPSIVAKYYDSNACIRNLPVFKKIAVAAADLNSITFEIETASMRQQNDVPVAQLTSTAPIVHVPTSSAIEMRSFTKKRQMNNEIILSASFQHSEYLSRFPGSETVATDVNEDLPHVDVPATANEPFLPTARDQEFMLDELVKSHRTRVGQQRQNSSTDSEAEERVNGRFDLSRGNKRSSPSNSNEINFSISSQASNSVPVGDDDSKQTEDRNERSKSRSPRQRRRKKRRSRQHVESPDSCSTTSTDDENERRRPIPSANAIREIEERGLDLSKPIVSLRDELRGMGINNDLPTPIVDSQAASTPVLPTEPNEEDVSPAVTTNIDGDIALSPGEVIQMAISVFRDDVENFQRLFSVYIDHSVGEPKRRYLCLTDRYVYVLSSTVVATATGRPITNLSRAAELSFLSSSVPIGSAPALESAAFSPSPINHVNAMEESRRRTISMAVTGTGGNGSRDELAADSTEDNLDNLTPEADGSLQITYRVETAVPLEEIEDILMGVDSQSVTIQTHRARIRMSTTDHELKQFVIETASQQLGDCIALAIQRAVKRYTRDHTTIELGSGLTMYSIILRNFVRRELGLPSVDIKHGVLAYWLQSAPPESLNGGNTLESFLFVRNFYPKAWRRKADKWTQSYFVLRGQMLYQFSDSTCKVAENSVNIRERVDEITPVDLRDDEKFVFELHFNDGSPNLQLSFNARDEMYKWMTTITMVFSTAVDDSLVPVACALILTDTNVLFAQEGTNCLVDGFMRLLLQLSIRDIASLAALRTPRHHILILRRESGASELIFLRNDFELQRLCSSFAMSWHLHVDELSVAAAQADILYSRAYNQCLQMSDVWSPQTTTELE